MGSVETTGSSCRTKLPEVVVQVAHESVFAEHHSPLRSKAELKMHRHTVYNHDDWVKHRSCWRHRRHLTTIMSSGVIVGLGPPVLLSTFVATLVAMFNHSVSSGHLPDWVPLLRVEPLPFTLTAPVLALLLVFRTNSSYNRFDEGRKAWGLIVNRARDMARQALTWIHHPSDARRLQCLLRHVKAFCFCLKNQLTATPRAPMDCEDGDTTLREELAGVLEPGRELEAVMRSKHRPNYVLQVISELIEQCEVPDWEKVRMDENITQFHDSVGTCERLFKTPIPLAYTRLTSRVLSLWHLSLPFALWNSCGWLTIPVTFLSGAALFYIEEVGVLIEEPFWILALSSISHGVCSALDGIAAAHKQAFLLSLGTHFHRHRSQQVQDRKHNDNCVVTISFDESSPSTPRVGVSKHRKNLSNVLARVNSVC